MKVREKITKITVSIYIVVDIVCHVHSTYKYFYIFLVKFLPLTIVLEIVKKIANIFDSYGTNETKPIIISNLLLVSFCSSVNYFCFALFYFVLFCLLSKNSRKFAVSFLHEFERAKKKNLNFSQC